MTASLRQQMFDRACDNAVCDLLNGIHLMKTTLPFPITLKAGGYVNKDGSSLVELYDTIPDALAAHRRFMGQGYPLAGIMPIGFTTTGRVLGVGNGIGSVVLIELSDVRNLPERRVTDNADWLFKAYGISYEATKGKRKAAKIRCGMLDENGVGVDYSLGG